MRKLFAAFLMTFIGLTNSGHATGKFHFKPVYNYDKAELVSQLKKTKTDTGKLNLLFSLAFRNNALVEGPGYIDTAYITQIISINKRANLFDDEPFRTLLAGLKEGIKTNYPAETKLLKTAVEEFDRQGIEVPMLLIEMRFVFNAAVQQEEKYRFYSQKLTYYLQKEQYENAAACYHCLGGYYLYKGDLNSTINNYLKAGELFKSFSHIWYMHEFVVVGRGYDSWGNRAKGRYYFQKALEVRSNSAAENDMAGTITSLMELEYDLKHYEASLAYVKKITIDSSVAAAHNYIVLYIGALKVMDLVALNRLDEARMQLDKIKDYREQTGLSRAIVNGAFSVESASYSYYLAVGDVPKAEKHLQKSYLEAKINLNVSEEITCLKELAKFYGDQRKTEQAWEYNTRYNRLNDSLQANVNSFNVASYETEQKENEQNKKLMLLRQQRAVQEATITQRNIIIWISMIGLLIMIGSLLFIYRQFRINKSTLAHLKTTQTQLIQSEKMASLGELTAGIAHEIQNPLNFVNNFSEVNTELIEEMQAEIDNKNYDEVKTIADDIRENQHKISQHGKRADFIVKGMLEHSRTSTGEKQPTDLNVLCDEFLKLSYHGLRAKDKNFNAELVTHFDKVLPKVNVLQQNIGRVMLNLFNNAFYAVNQKQKTAGADYKPEVSVTTAFENGHIIVKVKDNGNGIPDAIKDKIMQPFFTTKPTGEGTGLGLSLSYDIVVKGHGGSITVDTKEGRFTEFTISLPIL